MPRQANSGVLGKFMGQINKSMNNLYTTTYYKDPTDADSLHNLKAKINGNIDRIVNNNMDTLGMPSVSKLYSRMKFDLDRQNGALGRAGDVSDLFNDALNYDDFFATFQNNRYLMEMDAEIDSTCKYFPDLEEAINVMKEGVLSPDYFSKDFLSLSTSNSEDNDTFNERTKDLKKRYNLLPLIEDIYYHTSKYGEDFVYIVPYSVALSRLLTDKPKTSLTTASIEHEAAINEGMIEDDEINANYVLSVNSEACRIKDLNTGNYRNSSKKPVLLSESTSYSKTEKKNKAKIKSAIQEATTPAIGSSLLSEQESFTIQVELCKKGIIESVVRDAQLTNKRRNFMESTAGEFNRTVINEGKGPLKIVRKDKQTGKLSIDGMEKEFEKKDDLTADGLIGYANQTKDDKEVKVDVPGCVVSRIKREQVIPIYIGDNNTCLGYYYIEIRSYEALEDFRGLNYIMADSLTSLRGSNSGMNAPFNCVDPSRQEELLKYIAGQLSQLIDKEFVQANQDLRDEIYMILKYNDLFNTPAIDKVKITFIPPEDMIHFYFQLDPITHRGISDLDKAMVPAKIYASMYITDAIGKLVRGQDKRVFYVKQQVDTNIAQTLMNVINQVKQGNFGFRQFSNINNVLNITGKFNDLFIPVPASGDSPIQIETMPGQQFSDNSEQMQQLKEMAVNATGVPFEIVQTRLSVDYAMQLSMSNSKFLRKIYARQGIFAPYLSRLITKIYNFEYKDTLDITVQLPPPVFINTANTNQLVDNTKQFVQNIAEIDMANEKDEKVKNEYMKKLFQFYIGTHIDISRHEAILKKAMQSVTVSKTKEDEENNGY